MRYTEFFAQRVPNLPTPNDKGEVTVPCVFHKDSSPSLGINLETGKWKCFAPHCAGHKGGGWKAFDAAINGELKGGPAAAGQIIDPQIVDGFHKVLLQSPKMLELLQTKRGLSMDTITKFKLGFDSDRVWIPIPDETGAFVNVRKYKPGAKKDKMVAYATGYNRARLFPVTALASEWVVLCEGETDTLLAQQYGLPAITTTGGADTWLNEFTAQFKGKRVFICYDADAAGVKGGRAIAMRLLGVAAEVRVVKLPLAGTPEEKDITNYFVDLGHTRADFDSLLTQAELVEQKVQTTGPAADVLKVHLSEVGQDRFVGKRVTSTVLVAGKDLAPFQVPYRINYACEMGEKICASCGICRAGGQLEVTIPEWDPNFLQMVNVHQLTVDAIISNIAKVPAKCRKYKYEVKEYANIEAIKAIPEIDFTSERSEYVIRQLYYLGHGLETNHTYDITAIVMPDPKTQYATAVIYDAQESQDSIEKFELNEETVTLLNMFKVNQ